MQFDKYTGFYAIGDRILFRSLYGESLEVFTTPPDADSHMIAAALNNASNGVFLVLTSLTNYKY